MEILIGLFLGFFLTNNIKETKLYNDCKRGHHASCDIVQIKPDDKDIKKN